MGDTDHMATTLVKKLTVAWAAVGVATWTDAAIAAEVIAKFAGCALSVAMLCEWCYTRWKGRNAR